MQPAVVGLRQRDSELDLLDEADARGGAWVEHRPVQVHLVEEVGPLLCADVAHLLVVNTVDDVQDGLVPHVSGWEQAGTTEALYVAERGVEEVENLGLFLEDVPICVEHSIRWRQVGHLLAPLDPFGSCQGAIVTCATVSLISHELSPGFMLRQLDELARLRQHYLAVLVNGTLIAEAVWEDHPFVGFHREAFLAAAERLHVVYLDRAGGGHVVGCRRDQLLIQFRGPPPPA